MLSAQTPPSHWLLRFILSPERAACFQQCQSPRRRGCARGLLSLTFSSSHAPPESSLSHLTFVFLPNRSGHWKCETLKSEIPPGATAMPTCKRPLQRGVNKWKMEGGCGLIQADKYMKIYVCGCVSVLVFVCLALFAFVWVCVSVFASGGQFAQGPGGGCGGCREGALGMDLSEARGCALHH